MDPEEFVRQAGERMTADGSTVTEVPMMGGTALVGYRGEFRWSWLATKLHLFTVVLPQAVATEDGLANLIKQSLAYGKKTKGRFRGLQVGVAVIPVLVATTVEPAARAKVEAAPDPTWLVFARPAIVDLGAGQTYTYSGRMLRGGVYASWLKQRLAVVAQTDTARWAPPPAP